MPLSQRNEEKNIQSITAINNIPLKESLKDVNNLIKYLSENSIILNQIENLSFIGGFGEGFIYKARLKKDKREIILKLLFELNNEEINISKKLKHINIINCYDVIEIKKNVFYIIIMESAKFGDLTQFFKKIIKRKCISESLLGYITYQILNGLIYLHNCKILHMDIKPQNIVIDEFLNIKIIDFSISVNYRNTKDNKFKVPSNGTYYYMSPEGIKSNIIDINDISKIDSYSLGIMLYYFYFGKYPFELKSEDKNNLDKNYEKKMNNNLVFDDNNFSSVYFVDFLKKLLDKNIKNRMSIFEAIKHPWIQKVKILYDEKEKIYNANSFLVQLITDHIKNFEDSLKK